MTSIPFRHRRSRGEVQHGIGLFGRKPRRQIDLQPTTGAYRSRIVLDGFQTPPGDPGGRHQTRPVDRERRVGRPAAMPRARVERVAGRGLLRKGGGRAQLTVDLRTQHERQHQTPDKQKLCAPNRPREGLESSVPTSRGPSAFRRHFRDLVGSVNAVAEGFQALRRPPT